MIIGHLSLNPNLIINNDGLVKSQILMANYRLMQKR